MRRGRASYASLETLTRGHISLQSLDPYFARLAVLLLTTRHVDKVGGAGRLHGLRHLTLVVVLASEGVVAV